VWRLLGGVMALMADAGFLSGIGWSLLVGGVVGMFVVGCFMLLGCGFSLI